MSNLFKKKPITIEAHRWFKNGDHPEDGNSITEGQIVRYYRRPDCDGERKCTHCNLIMNVHGWIDTKEGGHIVCPGDWIITGVAGEKYPCKPDIFSQSYESIKQYSLTDEEIKLAKNIDTINGGSKKCTSIGWLFLLAAIVFFQFSGWWRQVVTCGGLWLIFWGMSVFALYGKTEIDKKAKKLGIDTDDLLERYQKTK